MNRARVLACTVRQSQPRVRSVLPREHLHFAFTMDDALRALTQADFDLVLIGMLFDESRGLELMQRIRANPSLAEVPIVGIRGAKQRRAVSAKAFDLPMRTLGARDVVDFGAAPDDETGNRRLRERVLACVRGTP